MTTTIQFVDFDGESAPAQKFLIENQADIAEAYECVKDAKREHDRLLAQSNLKEFFDSVDNFHGIILPLNPGLSSAPLIPGPRNRRKAKQTPSVIYKIFDGVKADPKLRVDVMYSPGSQYFIQGKLEVAKGLTTYGDTSRELISNGTDDYIGYIKAQIQAWVQTDRGAAVSRQERADTVYGAGTGEVENVPAGELWETEEFQNFESALQGLADTLPGGSEVFEDQQYADLVSKFLDQIQANIAKVEPCMEKLFRLHEKLERINKNNKNISSIRDLNNPLGINKLSPEEQAAQFEEARQQADEPIRSGRMAKVLQLPKNFREQCIFLAQIFQFAEYHRDIQMGSESKTTDTRDLADRMKKSMAQGLKTGQISVDKKLPYSGANKGSNSSLLVEGEAFGFINKLTQYGSMKNYFEATNAELAHLQPMIRLFKVTPSSGNREEQLEFPFDTFASADDVRDIFQKKEKRGFGAGIQKFNFTFHGSNPFAIKKSIKASLQIRANNFSELLKPRKNGLRYIDLALKTGSAIEEKYNKSELNFRIKAVVGLSVPKGLKIPKYNIEEGVKNNFTTLNLTPITHTFDFDDTGAVTFSIEYLAYVEEYFDKARMNIFANPEISKRVIQRKLAILTQKKSCEKKEEIDKLNKFIEQDADKIKEDKIKSLQFLTNELLKNDLIYYLNLTTEQFKLLVENGPFYNLGDIRNSISLTEGNDNNSKAMAKNLSDKFKSRYREQKDNKSLENSFKISGISNKNFAFFYLGDLLDLILKKIPQNLNSLQSIEAEYSGLSIDAGLLEKEKRIVQNSIQQFKKFRFVLGPLEIIDHREQSQVKQINFADLPISLSYFNEWLTSKLLSNDEVSYSLTTFLNDIMNHFITNFLNDDSCFSFNIKQKVRVFQNVVTGYSDDSKNDSITTYLENNKISRLSLNDENLARPIIETAGYRDFPISHKLPDKEFHFFVFYAGRVQPKELMKGNRGVDQEAGIFHYILGRDKGIVKTIKLDKTDSPASLKMVRFEQEGYDGLKQLREIYDVNIATFANVQTYPGTYIYVDPRGFSPILQKEYGLDNFDLTDLGIGGYYMIIESTHEFAPGTMNTNFKAKWVQSLDNNEGLQSPTASSIGSGLPTFKKCDVRS